MRMAGTRERGVGCVHVGGDPCSLVPRARLGAGANHLFERGVGADLEVAPREPFLE